MPRKTNFTTGNHNYFRTTATIGKKSDGTPLRKQFYGSSKKEAEQKRDEYIAGLKQGLAVDYDKATFGVAFKHWLEHVHQNAIGLSTYQKYSCCYRLHIANSGFTGMRLIDIKAANIQGYYNELLKTTTIKNIHQVHKILKIFFKYCLKADILIKNPLLAVELPKIHKQTELTNTALSDVDIDKLITACKENIKYFPFVFACFTGLRSGEILALTYKDIDFNNAILTVNKTVQYQNVDGKFTPIVSDTKTESSNRRIPIMPEIQSLLLEHINKLKQTTKIVSLTGDFLLFPSAAGTYWERSNFCVAYKRLCKRLKIEKGCTIHSLRHTFCTILARQGVSLLDASRLMGHSNINITAKIYSHVSDDDKKNAVSKLSSYFN